MKTIILTAGAALALAACGSNGDKAASAENGTAAAVGNTGNESASNGSTPASGTASSAAAPGRQASLSLEPGLYEIKMTMGAGGANGSHSGTNCLTREEVAKADAGLFNDKNNKSCTQQGFSFADGRIQGTLTCSGGDMPGKATVTMNGTYSSTGYDIDQKMAVDAGGMKMNIDSHITGRRVGECKPGDES